MADNVAIPFPAVYDANAVESLPSVSVLKRFITTIAQCRTFFATGHGS